MIRCIFCPSEFAQLLDLRSHSATCIKHPAVIEAAQLHEALEAWKLTAKAAHKTERENPVHVTQSSICECGSSLFTWDEKFTCANCGRRPRWA